MVVQPMEGFTSAQTDALEVVRVAAARVAAALTDREQAIANVEATGLPRDFVETAARTGRARRPVRYRPRFVSPSGTVLARTQREAISEVRRATSAAAHAREMQRDAIRRSAETGVALNVLAAEAHVALAEVHRITERVPVT
jgi:hypothetical protein